MRLCLAGFAKALCLLAYRYCILALWKSVNGFRIPGLVTLDTTMKQYVSPILDAILSKISCRDCLMPWNGTRSGW